MVDDGGVYGAVDGDVFRGEDKWQKGYLMLDLQECCDRGRDILCSFVQGWPNQTRRVCLCNQPCLILPFCVLNFFNIVKIVKVFRTVVKAAHEKVRSALKLLSY